MAIDASLRPFIAALDAAFGPQPERLSVVEYRSRIAAMAGEPVPLPAGVIAMDAEDAPVPVRLYRLAGLAGPLPCLLYFHGGGWVMGSILSHQPITAALALRAGIAVASVEYRLAPEYPFPAPFEDAMASLRWLFGRAASLGVDPSRIAIGGDSAGANLAAAAAQQIRAESWPALAAQLLFYPALDDYFDTASYHQNAAGPFLSRALARAFWGHYTAGQNSGAQDSGRRTQIAPLRQENLQGLPPAVILAAEHDPLRDEGIAYAAKLTASGISARLLLAEGMIHGFLRMIGASPAATRHFNAAADALAGLLKG